MQNHNDKIILKRFAYNGVIGMNAWQKYNAQINYITVKLYVNIEESGSKDLLVTLFDYSKLAKRITELLNSNKDKGFLSCLEAVDCLSSKLFNDKDKDWIKGFVVEIEQPKKAKQQVDSIKHIRETILDYKTVEDTRTIKNDGIKIKNIKAKIIIGINKLEREQKQEIRFDVLTKFKTEPIELEDLINLELLENRINKTNFKTIEALALFIAKTFIVEFGSEYIFLKLRKKSAISLAKYAGVEIYRHKDDYSNQIKSNNNLIALSLGSNIGKRYTNIKKAIDLLSENNCEIVNTSKMYKTRPMYYEEQENFLNCIVVIKSDLLPFELLELTQTIEKRIGKIKVFDNGPRVIDIDIVYFNHEVIKSNTLHIPHPGIVERLFVLMPLNDVAPSFVHPLLKLSTKTMLNKLLLKEQNTNSPSIQCVIPFDNGRILELDTKTHIVGILNITPDSFSDGGKFVDLDNALCHARKMIESGCDIIDVGGYSTRPGADDVSVEEELNRVVKTIQHLRKNGIMNLISVDTFRAKVAEEAVLNGADIINDVSGGLRDIDMYQVVRRLNVPYILMHSRGDQHTMTKQLDYQNGLVNQISLELNTRIHEAIVKAKIYRWNVIVDPGIGFAKNTPQNIKLIKELCTLKELTGNLPILIGPSRKRFLSDLALSHKNNDPAQRDIATSAVVAFSISNNSSQLVRVHNVEDLADVVKMCDILKSK